MNEATQIASMGITTMLELMQAKDEIKRLQNIITEAEKQEPVEYQIKILGERWTHCAKHIYDPGNPNTRALYTHPQPKREWVGLSGKERMEFIEMYAGINPNLELFTREIEAKLKEKNT